LRQLLIAETRDVFIHPFRAHMSPLERLLRLRGGKDLAQVVHVLLPSLRSRNGGLLKLVGRDEMLGRLCGKTGSSREGCRKHRRHQRADIARMVGMHRVATSVNDRTIIWPTVSAG